MAARNSRLFAAAAALETARAVQCARPPFRLAASFLSTVPLTSSSRAVGYPFMAPTSLAGTAVWNGDFPTSLGGTSVTINGRPAYLSFVSSGTDQLAGAR